LATWRFVLPETSKKKKLKQSKDQKIMKTEVEFIIRSNNNNKGVLYTVYKISISDDFFNVVCLPKINLRTKNQSTSLQEMKSEVGPLSKGGA